MPPFPSASGSLAPSRAAVSARAPRYMRISVSRAELGADCPSHDVELEKGSGLHRISVLVVDPADGFARRRAKSGRCRTAGRRSFTARDRSSNGFKMQNGLQPRQGLAQDFPSLDLIGSGIYAAPEVTRGDEIPCLPGQGSVAIVMCLDPHHQLSEPLPHDELFVQGHQLAVLVEVTPGRLAEHRHGTDMSAPASPSGGRMESCLRRCPGGRAAHMLCEQLDALMKLLRLKGGDNPTAAKLQPGEVTSSHNHHQVEHLRPSRSIHDTDFALRIERGIQGSLIKAGVVHDFAPTEAQLRHRVVEDKPGRVADAKLPENPATG